MKELTAAEGLEAIRVEIAARPDAAVIEVLAEGLRAACGQTSLLYAAMALVAAEALAADEAGVV